MFFVPAEAQVRNFITMIVLIAMLLSKRDRRKSSHIDNKHITASYNKHMFLFRLKIYYKKIYQINVFCTSTGAGTKFHKNDCFDRCNIIKSMYKKSLFNRYQRYIGLFFYLHVSPQIKDLI